MATRYLILGAGRFGRLAWRRLGERQPEAEFCLVDHDPGKLALIPKQRGTRTVLATAAEFFRTALEATPEPDWLIPAIPRHAAFEWLRGQLPADGSWVPIPVPPAVGRDLPFVLAGAAGEAYLSLSTQKCPDDCPEPAMECSLTGAPRPFNLYDYLEHITLPDYTSLVIRSRQLAPGVGGYRPADLRHVRARVLDLGGKILICTACRCHGVCHGLERLTGSEARVGI